MSILSRKEVLKTTDNDLKVDHASTTTVTDKTTAQTQQQLQHCQQPQQHLDSNNSKAETTVCVDSTACLVTLRLAVSPTALSIHPSLRSSSNRETTRGVGVSERGNPHSSTDSQ